MSGSPTSRAIPFLLLFLLAAGIFLGGLGRLPLFGRDESLYAEAAREMAASGDWVTPRVNGGAFFEKPPLYYWMAAAGYRVFGVSPLAARLPAALAAILTLVLVALIGARVWGRRAGLLAGLALATCLQIAVVGRMGIMDMPLALLTTLALLAYARWANAGGPLAAAAFGACVGLGVLLKGAAGLLPVAVALVDAFGRRVVCRAGTCPTKLQRSRVPESTLREPEGPAASEHPACNIPRALLTPVVAAAVCAAIVVPWFLAMSARHGEAFGGTFLLHEHLRRIVQPMQGHGGSFLIYLPLIALGFFPWVMLLPAGMLSRPVEETEAARFWRTLTVVWIGVVLVAFSAISTKLPGYVTPLYPAMALLAGAELDRRLGKPGPAPWVAVIIGGLAFAVLVAMLPAIVRPWAVKENLESAVGQLTPGIMVWVGGYLLIVLGALIALAGATAGGLAMIAAGQLVVLGAVLIGILPVLSLYLEGSREYRLASHAKLIERAMRERPGRTTLLYDTRPEAVAFVLEHPVPTFDRDQRTQLLAALRAGRKLLIAAPGESALWEGWPAEELARAGDRVLLDLRPPGAGGDDRRDQ